MIDAGNDPEEFDIIVEGEDDDSKPVDAAAPPAADAAGAEDDEDDDDDTRLAESQDDLDEDVEGGKAKTAREKRIERRERQRRAREASERQLIQLTEQNAQLAQRLAALEGNTLTGTAQSLAEQYHRAKKDAETAEIIMLKATSAGNDEDAIQARSIRDEANERANQFAQQYQQVEQARQQHANPAPDPRMLSHAREWMAANPWYDPNGADEESLIAKSVDVQLTREGYDPTSRDFWIELTRRLADNLIASGTQRDTAPPRRRVPPQGNSRPDVPVSGRKEIRVTRERKEAMIEAGVWDDPVRRNQMLKAYAEYDQQQTAR